jgi:uncharacterized protein (DUF1501 family)
MFSRRAFLRASLGKSTLAALAPAVPTFLARAARATTPAGDGRLLVVVQLSGGNDGINTVVPFKDEGYAKYRTTLRLPAEKLFKINRDVGLHPAMGDAAELLETGRLAIVQGVGYPNPSSSHFHSMQIWQTARLNPSDGSLGWIGQALDGGTKPADGSPAAQFVGSEAMPVALHSSRSVASAITRPEDFVLTLSGAKSACGVELEGGGQLLAFVRRSTLDAYATSERMLDVLRAEDTRARYPATELAGRLRLIARLIKGGAGTRVYYTAQGYGTRTYDTHVAQLTSHTLLLGELSGALRAFLDDLAAARLADRVLVLCFSEFGRSVRQEGDGTSHGAAGPVLMAGPCVKAGLIGETPELLDMGGGGLEMSIDFRSVYATVLEDWLGLPSKPSLGGEFAKLPLIRS